jgi:uncharacterized protein YndB with AHSA1/START domain
MIALGAIIGSTGCAPGPREEAHALQTVRIARNFEAPPELVWRAWTEPDILKRWVGSDPNGSVESVRLDARPGGSYEFVFRNANGEEHAASGTYVAFEPHRRLAFTWTWRSEPGRETMIVVALEPSAGGTLMRFEHSKLWAGSSHDYEAGWNSTFDKFERALRAPMPSSAASGK